MVEYSLFCSHTSVSYELMNHFSGSRNLPTIMSWVETQRPGVDGINIITSDFVELTDFANIVIRLNNLLLSETENRAR